MSSTLSRCFVVGSFVVSFAVSGCDDGPGVGTDQRAPDGASGRGGSGTGGSGGSLQTGGTSQAGGSSQVGGASQAGGSAAGGTSASMPNLCAGQPSPAGCVSQGCKEGETCVQRADVCVSSSCTCDPTSGWACTDDCGGGTCQPGGPTYFARLGFTSGQELLRDWCVAYEKSPDGQPVFAELGLLGSHFTDPKLFDGQPKLTRYLQLDAPPIAWGSTSTGTCGKQALYRAEASAVPYQTVLAFPESGEAMKMWSLTDSGPAMGSFVDTSVRVVNALASSETLGVTLVGSSQIALGAVPFGNAPGYTDLPGGTLSRVAIDRGDGSKAVVDFASFDLLSVERTTILLRGFSGTESALVCNDAKPTAGAFGEPPPDVFSSGCTVVSVK